MGPFSNNPEQPITPGPDRGNKLPVPDIEGMAQNVPIVVEPNRDTGATKKWLIATIIILAVMVIGGAVTFVLYVYVSNTPNYMLGAAMNNLVTTSDVAGNIDFQTKQDQTVTDISGNFLAYSDPTNSQNGLLTLSMGQDVSQVSGQLKVLGGSTYVQVTGLGNIGHLIDSVQGDSSAFTPDKLTELSALDDQSYALTTADVPALNSLIPQHLIQGNVTSNDITAAKQLYLKHPFIVSSQQLADEQINTITSIHLKLTVDRTKLTDFLGALRDAHLKSFTVTDADVTAISNNSMLSSLQVEAWISRSDRTFQQIKVTAPQSSDGADTMTIAFKYDVAATQRQVVTQPDSSKNATVLFKGIHDILSIPAATQ